MQKFVVESFSHNLYKSISSEKDLKNSCFKNKYFNEKTLFGLEKE